MCVRLMFNYRMEASVRVRLMWSGVHAISVCLGFSIFKSRILWVVKRAFATSLERWELTNHVTRQLDSATASPTSKVLSVRLILMTNLLISELLI